MRKVLIPIDFSNNSENAMNYVFAMFEDRDETEFVLLNAYDVPHGGSNTMLVSITDILKRDSEVGLKRTIKKIQESGKNYNIRTISQHGRLSSVIEEILQKEDFNLIVMGTLGAGGLKKVLIGSNTSEVVKKIKKPILIIPHEAKYVTPDKVLVTTDFKPVQRDEQLQRLKDFAMSINAKIFVLNVHESGKDIDLEKAKKESGIGELLEGLDHEYYEESNDDIIEGIDHFVQTHDVKIIAMVVRKLNFLDSLFHKSLTKEMAMRTKIPMLALHG